MAFTQADIDTLKSALISRKGAKVVQFSDQSVTFDSVDDMLKLLSVMQQEVSTTAGNASRTRFAATSKGC